MRLRLPCRNLRRESQKLFSVPRPRNRKLTRSTPLPIAGSNLRLLAHHWLHRTQHPRPHRSRSIWNLPMRSRIHLQRCRRLCSRTFRSRSSRSQGRKAQQASPHPSSPSRRSRCSTSRVPFQACHLGRKRLLELPQRRDGLSASLWRLRVPRCHRFPQLVRRMRRRRTQGCQLPCHVRCRLLS